MPAAELIFHIGSLFQDTDKTTPVTANNQSVGCAADLSTSGNDTKAAGSGTLPAYKIGIYNSRACLRFDGVSNLLQSINKLGVSGTSPRTVFFVAKLTDIVGAFHPFLMMGDPTANGTNFSLTTYLGNWFLHGGGGGDVASTVAADNDPHVHCLTYDGTSIVWAVDGVTLGGFSATRSLDTGAQPVCACYQPATWGKAMWRATCAK